jgi:hypothetical protein
MTRKEKASWHLMNNNYAGVGGGGGGAVEWNITLDLGRNIFAYRHGDDLWTHDGCHVGRFDPCTVQAAQGCELRIPMAAYRWKFSLASFCSIVALRVVRRAFDAGVFFEECGKHCGLENDYSVVGAVGLPSSTDREDGIHLSPQTPLEKASHNQQRWSRARI